MATANVTQLRRMTAAFIVAGVLAIGATPASAAGWCPLGYDRDGIATWRKIFNAVSSVFQTVFFDGQGNSCIMNPDKNYKL